MGPYNPNSKSTYKDLQVQRLWGYRYPEPPSSALQVASEPQTRKASAAQETVQQYEVGVSKVHIPPG